ncbi:MarR family winged helix-turn-helix transcriptional regulator [Frondihabitans australicus]|nr:MarR family transcriptional regulator [Frondihabitans australicus]
MGPLRDDLGWALRAISIAFQERAGAAVVDIPSGPRGYLVLLAISGDETPSQLQLAQTLGLDKTRMTYLIDDLEAAGLVTRAPDPADRRARLTSLTPDGRRTLAKAKEAITAVEDDLLGGVAEPAREAFRSGLAGVALGVVDSGR